MQDNRYRREYLRRIRQMIRDKELTDSAVAKKVGRSRAWISQVMRGRRRLLPKPAVSLLDVLGADEHCRREILSMVDLDCSDSVLAKEQAQSVLVATMAEDAARSTPDHVMQALSTWYAAAIVEVARCEDYEPDPEWIAATLVPRITPEQARESLLALRDAGLLDERFEIPEAPPTTSTPCEVPETLGELAKSFHESVLTLGAASIRRFRGNERLVRGACAALSEEAVERFRRRLRELLSELLHASRTDPATPNRVYFLDVAFFPASLYTDTEYDPMLFEDEPGF